MTAPLKFAPEGSFTATLKSGPAVVWTGLATEDSIEERAHDWIGREVEVNGRLGTIKAVETHATPLPVRKGDYLGLVIEYPTP